MSQIPDNSNPGDIQLQDQNVNPQPGTDKTSEFQHPTVVQQAQPVNYQPPQQILPQQGMVQQQQMQPTVVQQAQPVTYQQPQQILPQQGVMQPTAVYQQTKSQNVVQLQQQGAQQQGGKVPQQGMQIQQQQQGGVVYQQPAGVQQQTLVTQTLETQNVAVVEVPPKKFGMCFPVMICGLVCFVVFLILFLVFFVISAYMETGGLEMSISGEINTTSTGSVSVSFSDGYIAADIATKVISFIIGIVIVILGILLIVCSLKGKALWATLGSVLQMILIVVFFFLTFIVQLVISIYLIVWMVNVSQAIFGDGTGSGIVLYFQLFVFFLVQFFPAVFVVCSFVFVVCIFCCLVPFCCCVFCFCIGETDAARQNKENKGVGSIV